MATICLNMIVRDEAAVIERCLASVRPYIDSWVIVDTGSLDDTPARIVSTMAGVPGELHHRAWRNFCLLYTSPSPRDRTRYRMPSSA